MINHLPFPLTGGRPDPMGELTHYLLCTHLLPLTVLLLSLFSTIIQYTPLHASSENGCTQVVDILLSQPGIVVDSHDKVW